VTKSARLSYNSYVPLVKLAKYLRLQLEILFLFLGRMVELGLGLILCFIKLKFNPKSFFEQSIILVLNSLSPVIVIGIALGVVIGVQMGPEFVAHGLGNKLGIISALTMTRELMPVIGSLMIATQFGTGIAAEIANMKISEQIDALKVFRVDHIEYLVMPRFMAAIVFCPVIVWISAVVSVFSTFVTVYINHGIRFQGYINSIWDYLQLKDIGLCLIKSSIFGALIVLIALAISLSVRGGAKEVGKATTQTVITSFIFIVLVDFIITTIYL
jgi:phospholipid/cholesterol/gamma-HCH transport system permease protein